MDLWKPAMWAAKASLERGLRIHVALPELWQEVCDQEWGYAYHLERWFRQLLLEHLPGTLTPDPDLADFVYVPHCAMNLYLSWKQAAVQSSARHGVWLPVHGDGHLHGAVQEDVDRYLALYVARAALQNPSVRNCQARYPACQLLFVNMFGRDELKRFHAIVPHAVFVTTAGGRRLGRPQRRRACACAAHCRSAVSLGPLDIVVPWNIAHNSTSKQVRFGFRRPLLAFFAGANTSCSRAVLVRRWGNRRAREEHGMLVGEKAYGDAAFAAAARRAKFCKII
ncbi:unnamed protein product [Symbiodinium natans]|uniref:Uncharacterized protein n=1 Tax=Symbiodinium natans TaxID=878477 RepID=A0A812IK51_9DINO|nr:unnamed protein product [Symbiodinium natans]